MSFDAVGYDRAQEVMALAERHGWRMLCDPRPYGWTKLELWRDAEYLQINWKGDNGRSRLADTRRYRSATTERRRFTLAEARRIITRPA